MFDELASIFFFSSAGGDADSYRAAATKPGTPAGSPSPRPRRGRRLPMWLGLPRFPATGTLQSAVDFWHTICFPDSDDP